LLVVGTYYKNIITCIFGFGFFLEYSKFGPF
jgi:hypothetical protein